MCAPSGVVLSLLVWQRPNQDHWSPYHPLLITQKTSNVTNNAVLAEVANRF